MLILIKVPQYGTFLVQDLQIKFKIFKREHYAFLVMTTQAVMKIC